MGFCHMLGYSVYEQVMTVMAFGKSLLTYVNAFSEQTY